MYDYTYIPSTREKKKRPVLKTIAIMLCAMMLMAGSGYIGARVSQMQHNLQNEADAVQAYVPQEPTIPLTQLTETPLTERLSLPDLFDGANPAVVALSTEITGRNVFGQTITRPSAGSGFLISPDGYIVTNDHVIDNANSITVMMYDGNEFPATVIGRDPGSDLALIKIEGNNLPHLAFGDSDAIRVGDQVAAIGNPLGQLANSMTVGHISALNRDISIEGMSHTKLQTDTAVNRGNSGGPLLNLYGEVIGVVSAKSTGVDVEGLGFAIPANHAQSVVNQLKQHGYVRGRAILGVNVGVNEATGNVQVISVNHGSAAERAGIMPGDLILSANGIDIANFMDLRAVLDSLSPGDTIEIQVQRQDDELTLTVVLDEYRPVRI